MVYLGDGIPCTGHGQWFVLTGATLVSAGWVLSLGLASAQPRMCTGRAGTARPLASHRAAHDPLRLAASP